MSEYVEFYSQHVKSLEKAGRQYLGYCPFHDDEGSKHKGFSVNPDNGLWRCFSGCGAGNTITFCSRMGIDKQNAPDYNPKFRRYNYGGGVAKKKSKKKSYWEGAGGGLPTGMKPYNHQAVRQAQEKGETLWICEGEKDTETMHNAGAFAIGIPSATMDKVLDGVSLVGIPSVIIAFDNDSAGRKATEKVLQRFPFASVVNWENVSEGLRKGYDVTDYQEDIDKHVHDGPLVETLERCAAARDPFCPLTDVLLDKAEQDGARDPDKLLGYELNKFTRLARNIDGVQPGFYVVGAETNAGKTAFLCSLLLDLLDSNQDLTGIYFSLDDPKSIIINRFLGIKTGVPLNQVQRRQDRPEWQGAIHGAYSHLYGLAEAGRLYLWDVAEIQDIDDVELEIRRRMNRKLFVIVDGLYNLDVGGDAASTRTENIERANALKRLADVYSIPVICSGELRKKERGQTDREPAVDDIMETGKFAYNANLVLMLYPEKWQDYNDSDKPVIKLKYAKNKLSHYRKTDELVFDKKTSRVTENITGHSPLRTAGDDRR